MHLHSTSNLGIAPNKNFAIVGSADMIVHFRLAVAFLEPAGDGVTNQASIWTSKAEKFQLVTVDIFGSCLPRVRAGEEYLGKLAGSHRSDYF